MKMALYLLSRMKQSATCSIVCLSIHQLHLTENSRPGRQQRLCDSAIFVFKILKTFSVVDHFLKVFIESVTVLLPFCFGFLATRYVGS